MPHFALLCSIMYCYVLLCTTMLPMHCYALPCTAMLHHVLLCCTMYCYAPSCPTMLHSLLCSTMHCYAPSCTAMLYYVLLCSIMHCYASCTAMLQCTAMLHHVLLCCTMHCYAPLCNAMLHYLALCSFTYKTMIGWLPLSPFQMLNSNLSQWRQLALLIIKVPKASLHHVPRCYAPAISINKLTLNEPAISPMWASLRNQDSSQVVG